ncbi:MAG: sulfurtransferase [Halothiobacillaceae bacterium]
MSIKTMKMTSVAAAMLLASGAVQAIEVPGPLVSPEWLNEHRDEVVVLQTTASADAFVMPPEYARDEKTGKTFVTRVSGHIPGAVFVDYKKDVRVKRDLDGRQLKGLVPLKEDWEAKVRKWGVDQDDAIVIVSDGLSSGDVTSATRTYWTFKYFGHDNMAILDGGLARWLDEGYEATTDSRAPDSGDWQATAQRDELLATKADVAAAAKAGDIQLIDGRSYDQHLGVAKSGSVDKAGHVPGSRPFPIELYTRADGASAKFFPESSYENLMAANGIDVDSPAIAYCNTGNVASAPWFIMHELLGNKNVTLYDASMHEYTKDDVEMVNAAQVFD